MVDCYSFGNGDNWGDFDGINGNYGVNGRGNRRKNFGCFFHSMPTLKTRVLELGL
jgi:hypothetical protein